MGKVIKRVFAGEEPVHFVSGLWLFEGNPKHSANEYRHRLPATLDLVSSPKNSLTFFSGDEATASFVEGLSPNIGRFESKLMMDLGEVDPDLFDLIRENRRAVNEMMRFLPTFFARLPFPRAIRHDKAFRKFFAMVRKSDETTYSLITQVVLTRPLLMEMKAKNLVEHGHGGALLCWIDAGLSHLVGGGQFPSNGYHFDPTRINHLPSPMYFMGRKQDMRGGLILASAENWLWLADRFRIESRRLLRWRYLQSDETVFNWILRGERDRFRVLSETAQLR